MLRSFVLALILCLTDHATAAAAADIRPINSWADFRVSLKERGRTDAQADDDIARLFVYRDEMDRTAGDDLIGQTALPFRFNGWLNSSPLTVQDLRGSVVLVRWWTDTCPFCASSAPALRALHAEYAGKGLKVIGVFHPKQSGAGPLDIDRVRRAVDARRFRFPIAIDWNWREGTLKDWWLGGPERPSTSVTFILDKQGIIRFVHPAMEYHDDNGSPQHQVCVDDMGRIRGVIEALLAE